MDQSVINQLQEFIAAFTLFGDIVLLTFLCIVLLNFISHGKIRIAHSVLKFMNNYGMLFAFIIAFFATTGSLFLSEAAKLPPCKLCWYQRIFMYPLAVIFPIALLVNDAKVKKYVIPLTVIGAVIALYHTLLQVFPASIQCGDDSVSCAQKFTVYYGYITIPVMSLTAFLLILLFTILSKRIKIDE